MKQQRTYRQLNRAPRSLLLLLLGLGVTLGVSVAGWAWPEPADAGSDGVFQWNIQGGCAGSGNCGNIAPATTANFFVAVGNPKPLVLTFNEVCGRQYAELSSYLESNGYDGAFQLTAGGVNCGEGSGRGVHGNAIFQAGVALSESSYYYANQAPSGDVRGLYCMINNIFGFIRSSCVTHLHNQGTYTAAQNAEAAWIMTASSGSTPTKLGADLNSTAPQNWWAFWEVDSSRRPTFNVKGTLNKKLDWFLGGTANHTGFGNASRYCSAALSDHCALSGRFTTP